MQVANSIVHHMVFENNMTKFSESMPIYRYQITEAGIPVYGACDWRTYFNMGAPLYYTTLVPSSNPTPTPTPIRPTNRPTHTPTPTHVCSPAQICIRLLCASLVFAIFCIQYFLTLLSSRRKIVTVLSMLYYVTTRLKQLQFLFILPLTHLLRTVVL